MINNKQAKQIAKLYIASNFLLYDGFSVNEDLNENIDYKDIDKINKEIKTICMKLISDIAINKIPICSIECYDLVMNINKTLAR